MPLSQGRWPKLTGLSTHLVDIEYMGFDRFVLGALPCLQTVCRGYCNFVAIVPDSLVDPWSAMNIHHFDGDHYDSAAVVAVRSRKRPALRSLSWDTVTVDRLLSRIPVTFRLPSVTSTVCSTYSRCDYNDKDSQNFENLSGYHPEKTHGMTT